MAEIVPLGVTLGLTRPGPSNAPKISFAAKDIDVLEWEGDLMAVGVIEKDLAKDDNSKFKNPILHMLDTILGGLLAEASAEEDFSGKSGQSIILRVSGLAFKRVGLFGLGQLALTAAALQGLGEAIAAAARASQAKKVAIALAFAEDLPAEFKPKNVSAIAIGVVLGIFEDNRYRSESKKSALSNVDFLGLGSGPELDKKLGVTAAATANRARFIHLCYKPPACCQ